MAKNEKDVSRRDFLQRLGLMGAAGVGSSVLLSACGGGGGQQGGGTGSAAQQGGTAAATDTSRAAASSNLSCNDLSALSQAELQQRKQMVEALQYVPETPNPEQYCSNCALYQPPAQEPTTGSQCGGCQLFPGPVNPNGYCTSWAPAA